MRKELKIAIFQPYLDKFETEEIKLYCTDMIKLIPDYIFTMPSSTTGKHHNKTQCQTYGQIYHIIMFAEILNYLLDLKHNKEKFNSPIERDAMRCTPFFHDAWKCGEGKAIFTVHNHPLIAGKWIRETKVEHEINEELKEMIACMCERHSGEYTTSKKNKIVLPEPENDRERLIHECDILSSRSNIDMIYPEYLKQAFYNIEYEMNFDNE